MLQERMDRGPLQPTETEKAASFSDGASGLYRTMFEQSPFSTQILAPDGTSLRVNGAWERLWGLTPEQVRGWNILTDPQLAEAGLLPFIQKGFLGEATEIPPMKYRPAESLLEAGP